MTAIQTTNQSTAIAKASPNLSIQVQSMEDLERVSGMLAKSGYFTDAKDAAQCGVKVLAGAEMGIGAFSAMSGIHIIKGKPSIGANLMAAAVKRHPSYNYRVLENSEEVCKIEFYERWDGKLEACGVSTFTIADAKNAGTQNIGKFTRNMLFSRAMSNGVKWYCPDVFSSPVYTPEELGAEVNEDGEYVEVDVTVEPTIITPKEIAALRNFISDNGITPDEAMKITGGKKAHQILASELDDVMEDLGELAERKNAAPEVEVVG